jgi:hypothetical protein
MASRLLFGTRGEVLVAYRTFLLQEAGGPMAEEIEIERSADGVSPVAAGGDGGVIFCSAANDHYPSVRLELWSGEPPRSEQAWETARDETFTVSRTGRVELTGLFGMPSDAAAIVLPGLGAYRVRVYARGRDEASERGEAEFFHDVEHWLVQIWPPTANPRTASPGGAGSDE